MQEKIQFEKSLAVMRFSLLMSGIKTKPINSKLLDIFLEKYLFYLNLFILHSVVGGEIYWFIHGMFSGKSFIELSYILPLIVISIVASLKSFFLFVNKDKILYLIDTLKNLHPEDKDDLKIEFETKDRIFKSNGEDSKIGTDIQVEVFNEREIINSTVAILNTIIKSLIVISTAVLFMFLLTPILLVYVKYFKTGEFEILFPFTVLYWFDIYNTVFWPVLYVHQVFATGVCCANLFATELLFYVICSYIEMHFRILGNKFNNITSQHPVKTREEISDAVKTQQLLIYLVTLGNKIFTKSSLVHIVTSSFLICLSAFNITMATDINTVVAFIAFLNLSLSHVSLLCFFGDKLMESSLAMSNAVYQCPWYDFNYSTKKDVYIILIRSQKPCKFTASNFADLNLRAFTTILSRSWSYFALLKTIFN